MAILLDAENGVITPGESNSSSVFCDGVATANRVSASSGITSNQYQSDGATNVGTLNILSGVAVGGLTVSAGLTLTAIPLSVASGGTGTAGGFSSGGLPISSGRAVYQNRPTIAAGSPVLFLNQAGTQFCTLAPPSGYAPLGFARALIRFNGVSMGVNGNVGFSGLTKLEAGKYRLTFTQPMVDANYCAMWSVLNTVAIGHSYWQYSTIKTATDVTLSIGMAFFTSGLSSAPRSTAGSERISERCTLESSTLKKRSLMRTVGLTGCSKGQNKMLRRFHQCMTESNNQTHDLTKWLALSTVLTFLGINIYLIGWTERPWTSVEFGAGCAAIFGGLGLALKLKPESPA